MKTELLEAIHLVALEIDALRKERKGSPEAAKARKLSDEAVVEWKNQLWAKKTCPHCGARI